MDLVKAGNEAVAEIYGPRTPGTPEMYGFVPSADGVVLLQQPFSPGFAGISKDIPLMTGTTLNELMRTYYAEKRPDNGTGRERLAKSMVTGPMNTLSCSQKLTLTIRLGILYPLTMFFRPYTIGLLMQGARRGRCSAVRLLPGMEKSCGQCIRGSFHESGHSLAFL